MQLLLAVNPQLLEVKDSDGNTPLILAAYFGQQSTCEVLLKLGAQPANTRDHGRNALHCAAVNGKTEIVKLLSSNKQLLNTKDHEGNTPLILAAGFGHVSTCEVLLKAGADPTAASQYGRNALHSAAFEGKAEIVRLFATNKQLLEVRDHNGDTPLTLAARQGHHLICETLLKAGATPSTPGQYGRNAFYWAISYGHIGVIQLFAANKQLLEIKDTKGNTPLILAAICGNVPAFEILLKAGANRSATNNLGRNALHRAASGGQAEVVALLASNKQLLEAKDTEG